LEESPVTTASSISSYPSTNAPLTAPGQSWLGVSRATWWKVGTLAFLFCWLFYEPCLRRLWHKTNPLYGESEWGHSCIIPLIGLYYLYVNREELLKARFAPVLVRQWSKVRWMTALALALAGCGAYAAGLGLEATGIGANAPISPAMVATTVGIGTVAWAVLVLALNAGLGTLLFGVLVTVYGIYPGQNDYLKDLGMVVALFGLVLYLCGWHVMRIAWFPIVFLVCALPWPGLVYSWVASPLQELAARVAVKVMQFTGVDAMRNGTKIVFDTGKVDGTGGTIWRPLNVAEACAGLRSLMTFISVGAALAFLSSRPLWQKLFQTAAAVPIAIFCNVMRVSGQGLLDRYVSQELSQDFAHQFVGLLMLIPAFFLLLLVGWFLDKLFIEEADASTKTGAATSGRPQDELVVDIPRRRPLGATGAAAAVPAAAGGVAPSSVTATSPGAPAAPAVMLPPRPKIIRPTGPTTTKEGT
jgi:exosortase